MLKYCFALNIQYFIENSHETTHVNVIAARAQYGDFNMNDTQFVRSGILRLCEYDTNSWTFRRTEIDVLSRVRYQYPLTWKKWNK